MRAVPGVLMLVVACGGARSPSSADAQLTEVTTSSTMVWNGVVVTNNRIFVEGQRWAQRGPAPSVAELKDGKPVPYPDAGWNAWEPGAPVEKAFVDVNSMHADAHGLLWVVDTGTPRLGVDPLPDAAKLVVIDPGKNEVVRIVPLAAAIAKGSYPNDIRFGGSHAYLTDTGAPGLIVVELASGKARRVLDGHPSTRARPGRKVIADGKELAMQIAADPIEVSPDGQWLYYGPLAGPWSRIATRWLDDPAAGDLGAHVEPWADLPPVGGTAMAPDGTLYFGDIAADAVKKRAPDGTITTVATDPRLHWVDAMWLEPDGTLWAPTPELDRIQAGKPATARLWKLRTR